MFAEVLLSLIAVSESSASTMIILGAFTLIGTTITATFSYLSTKHARVAKNEAKQANDAVNHRSKDQPRLVELVADVHSEVKTLAIESKLQERRMNEFIELNSHRHRDLSKKIHQLAESHRQHLESIGSDGGFWDGIERRKHKKPVQVDRRESSHHYTEEEEQ